MEDPTEIEVGRDGLILECRGYSGLLLPQVATEWGFDRERFLAEVSLKAGLDADGWKDSGRPDLALRGGGVRGDRGPRRVVGIRRKSAEALPRYFFRADSVESTGENVRNVTRTDPNFTIAPLFKRTGWRTDFPSRNVPFLLSRSSSRAPVSSTRIRA